MTHVQNITVEENDADIRLDRWFKRHFPSVKNSMLQKWLRTGQVRLDGKRVKANARLEAGQRVRIPPGAENPQEETRKPVLTDNFSEAEISALTETILYQDDDVIVLNKPAGLAVQGGSKTKHHLDAMLDYLKFDGTERPRLVHRLDKDTSGVLLLARTRKVSTYLTGLFSARLVRKLYWALVVGVPPQQSGTINSALLKSPGRGGEKMRVDVEAGKPAATDYRIIDTTGHKAAWLELEPKTGRTHQIRAHCASMGTPILGDGKYGGSRAFLNSVPNTRKLHLHAQGISLALPSGEKKHFEAPLPAVMAQTWKWFGFDPDSVHR
ncbi:MAG: RluA family pseudouridine synthase [Rhodospirillaceae bacterium]